MSSHILKLAHGRMGAAAFASVLLFILACVAHWFQRDSLLATSLYKAHLMVLGGWGGYWIDRALFPYARPDSYLLNIAASDEPPSYHVLDGDDGWVFAMAGVRRALIVLGCLLCVGLGA